MNQDIIIKENCIKIEQYLLDFKQYQNHYILSKLKEEFMNLSMRTKNQIKFNSFNRLLDEILIILSNSLERKIVLKFDEIDLLLTINDSLLLYLENKVLPINVISDYFLKNIQAIRTNKKTELKIETNTILEKKVNTPIANVKTEQKPPIQTYKPQIRTSSYVFQNKGTKQSNKLEEHTPKENKTFSKNDNLSSKLLNLYELLNNNSLLYNLLSSIKSQNNNLLQTIKNNSNNIKNSHLLLQQIIEDVKQSDVFIKELETIITEKYINASYISHELYDEFNELNSDNFKVLLEDLQKYVHKISQSYNKQIELITEHNKFYTNLELIKALENILPKILLAYVKSYLGSSIKLTISFHRELGNIKVLISDRGSAFANQLKAQDITKLINGISNKITIKNNGSFNLIELRLKEYNTLVSYIIFKSNQQLYAIPLASCTSINQNVGPHSIIKKSFYSNRASTFNESKQLITFNYKNETFTLECDDIVTSTSLVVKDLPENLSDNKYVSAIGQFSTNSVLILELEDLIESFKK